MTEGQSSWDKINKYTFADGRTSAIWYNSGTFVGDNKTVLDPEDDAATANWGSNWRMPTDAELTELRTSCTWTWTTQNGVNGYKVTGKNGNSIFLPATGYRYDGSLSSVGSYGDYWSSSLDEYDSRYVRDMSFNSSYVRRYYGYRYYGFSVRPVCP